MYKKKDLKGQYTCQAIFKAAEFNGVPFTLENKQTIIDDITAQLKQQGATVRIEYHLQERL